jgi:putative ubiquitin-RnfH superfamily antitoxin RatB of RatAB toxin-antitoxin module
MAGQDMSSAVSEPPDPAPLAPRQAIVALALAQGVTITAAAAAAGLNRCTIHRWLHTPRFEEAVRQNRAGFMLALRDAPEKLRAQAHAAVEALLTDPKTPRGERLRLAIDILNRPV